MDENKQATPVETDKNGDLKDASDGPAEDEDKPKTRRKSSSLSRRISSTSNLDNVNLDDEAPPSEGSPHQPA